MAWSAKHDPSIDIVEVVYTDRLTGTELREAASERIRLQKETGTMSALVDASGIEHMVAGTMDVFGLPDELYDSKEANRKSRMALVLPKARKEREVVKFFEAACENRGWRVKAFEERQAAVDWLRESKPSNKPDALDRL
jgi:hypothetical protein